MSLKVASYNCRGLNIESLGVITELCKSHDIVLLQETWLTSDTLCKLNEIDSDFNAAGISSIDASSTILNGRPYNGLGILWKNVLNQCIKVVKYDNERIMGIEVIGKNETTLFLNIYMPYEHTDNFVEFLNHLAQVNAIIQSCDTNHVVVLGDFNANFNKSFGIELLEFATEHGLCVSDKILLSNKQDVYTYVSEAHNTTSWIDHCVSTVSAHNKICSIDVIENLTFTDHMPLSVCYNSSCENVFNVYVSSRKSDEGLNRITDWDNASDNDLQYYSNLTDEKLSNLCWSYNVLYCTDIKCTNSNHIDALNAMYNDVTDCLRECGYEAIGTKSFKHYKCVPGWNDYVKEHHQVARDAFIMWRDQGKPRQGILHVNMLQSRARFKHVLKDCKRNEEQLRADALAQSLSDNDYIQFWKDVNSINNKKAPKAMVINGASGEVNIANMWKEHFKSIFNCVSDDRAKSYVYKKLNNVSYCTDYQITPLLISECIAKLKFGKANGADLLQSEHLKYASQKLSVMLSLIFNSMLLHGHLPDSLMKTVIIPLVKNRAGNLSDTNNYRPVALATAMSKLFEHVLLNKIEIYMYTSHNQFGFKKGYSTDMCLFVFKQVIEYYNSRGSPVFVCYLDASKAYDRVQHWLLFKKLI